MLWNKYKKVYVSFDEVYQKYKPFSLIAIKHIPCLSSGCYKNIPQTEWVINRKFFHTFLETRSLRSGASTAEF